MGEYVADRPSGDACNWQGEFWEVAIRLVPVRSRSASNCSHLCRNYLRLLSRTSALSVRIGHRIQYIQISQITYPESRARKFNKRISTQAISNWDDWDHLKISEGCISVIRLKLVSDIAIYCFETNGYWPRWHWNMSWFQRFTSVIKERPHQPSFRVAQWRACEMPHWFNLQHDPVERSLSHLFSETEDHLPRAHRDLEKGREMGGGIIFLI